MIVLAIVAMLSPVPQNCAVLDGIPVAEGEGPPVQKSGEGLWIGGLAFGKSDILAARAVQEPVTEGWALQIGFTDAGRVKFAEAQRCGVNQPIEISFDGTVLSRPRLMEPITGPEVMISGNLTKESASDMAARIAPPSPEPSSAPAPH